MDFHIRRVLLSRSLLCCIMILFIPDVRTRLIVTTVDLELVLDFLMIKGAVWVCEPDLFGGLGQAKKLLNSTSTNLVLRNVGAEHRSLVEESSVVFCDIGGLERTLLRAPRLGIGRDVLVLSNTSALKSEILVNQRIFFYDQTTGSLTENYTLKGQLQVENQVTTIRKNSESTSSTLETLESDHFLKRRSNLHGLHLNIIVAEEKPHLFVSRELTGEDVLSPMEAIEASGKLHDLTLVLAHEMNWTATRQLFEGSDWGSQQGGEWTGIVKLMVAGSADVAAASVDITTSRFRVLDYAWPMVASRDVVVVRRRSSSQSYQWKIFVMPFSEALWIGIMLNTVVYAVVFTEWSYFRDMDVDERSFGGVSFKFLQASAAVLGSLFGRKLSVTSDSSSDFIRCLIFFVCIGGTVMFIAYKASLTTILTTSKFNLPFYTLEALAGSDFR